MSDHIAEERVHDYVDDMLSPDERRDVAAHLAGCAPCRAEVDAVTALRNAARALAPGIAPAVDFWPSIASRLEPELRVLPSPRALFVHRALAAAAAVAVILTALWTTDRLGGAPAPGGNPDPAHAVLARMEMAAAEAHYESAASDLRRALDARRSGLAAETAAVIEKNLDIIDAALDESRKALAADPANRTLTDLVASAHRRKVEFLQLALNY